MNHGNEKLTDPVEEMLKRTGCIELHYTVQVLHNEQPTLP